MYIILYLCYLFGSFIIEVGVLAANPTKNGGVITFGIFRILIQMYIIYFTIKLYEFFVILAISAPRTPFAQYCMYVVGNVNTTCL